VLHKPSANQHVSGSSLRPFRSVDTSSRKIQDDVNQFLESVSDLPNNLRDIYSQLFTENGGPSSVPESLPKPRKYHITATLGEKICMTSATGGLGSLALDHFLNAVHITPSRLILSLRDPSRPPPKYANINLDVRHGGCNKKSSSPAPEAQAYHGPPSPTSQEALRVSSPRCLRTQTASAHPIT
jgi:hypothetical protein